MASLMLQLKKSLIHLIFRFLPPHEEGVSPLEEEGILNL